jgi:hypothetical protein
MPTLAELPGTRPTWSQQRTVNRVGGHDRGEKPEFISLLWSDTLTQHQSDSQHRLNLIPARCQKDDTNRVDLAARTTWVDVTGADSESVRNPSPSVSPEQIGTPHVMRWPKGICKRIVGTTRWLLKFFWQEAADG